MRLYPAITCLLKYPLIRRPCIFIVFILLFVAGSAFEKNTDRDSRSRQVNLVIRQIGHKLLLQGGDSSSRVLPVTERKEGIFRLRFENDFNFSPDSLIALSNSLLPKTQFAAGYTVTVLDCSKSAIVYGFQFNNNAPDILACKGRLQPRGCYTIEFAFADFYSSMQSPIAGTGQQFGSANNQSPVPGLQSGNGPQESSQGSLQDGEGGLKEQAAQVNTGTADFTRRNDKLGLMAVARKDIAYPVINFAYGGIIILLLIFLLINRFGKNSKAVAIPHQKQETMEELTDNLPGLVSEITDLSTPGVQVPALPSLGKFLFDLKGQRLVSGDELIDLTDKECRVLELLHKNFGELITRETLLQEVWINDGVITGRSLDMFVSKLRKKLSGDAELRITNVHGKGYRLEGTPSYL